jgi:hypothetical protein
MVTMVTHGPQPHATIYFLLSCKPVILFNCAPFLAHLLLRLHTSSDCRWTGKEEIVLIWNSITAATWRDWGKLKTSVRTGEIQIEIWTRDPQNKKHESWSLYRHICWSYITYRYFKNKLVLHTHKYTKCYLTAQSVPRRKHNNLRLKDQLVNAV